MKLTYLNVAAGKIQPIDFKKGDGDFLIQLDKMYFSTTEISILEILIQDWLGDNYNDGRIYYSNEDALEFLGRFNHLFDFVSCYRFLEHVEKTDIQSFIYLLSTSVKIGGQVDIIVPNYETLAKLILDENLTNKVRHLDWERHDTLLTYELLNYPGMPHASIWTPDRIKYFFELEHRFVLTDLDPKFLFDGRDCHIRATLKRVK